MRGQAMNVLYLGDDSAAGAAAYLCGVLEHSGINFRRVNSNESPSDDVFGAAFDVVVVSDYPAANFRDGQLETLKTRVRRNDCGLIMIGGWESFHGLAGEYHNTPLVEVLPIEMATSDDRVNCPQPVFVVPANDAARQHTILRDLPWERPTAIGGFNRVKARSDGDVLLEGVRAEVSLTHDLTLRLVAGRRDPLLVIGRTMRVAALMTDVAPHWVGQLVDWGDKRITQTISETGGFIEVGDAYVRFLKQLIAWTGRE
ncbi:MAG: glutamine amidotransferase [Thermoguttaceae bacterium]